MFKPNLQIWLNDYTSSLGIGAFHSGTEVHGRGTYIYYIILFILVIKYQLICIKNLWLKYSPHTEYAYGGHPYSYTGVYDTEPKQAAEAAGQGVKYKESLLIGTTVLSHDEVQELIRGLGKRYNGNAYHILNKWVLNQN